MGLTFFSWFSIFSIFPGYVSGIFFLSPDCRMTINCCIRRSMAMQWIKRTQNLKKRRSCTVPGMAALGGAAQNAESNKHLVHGFPTVGYCAAAGPGLFFFFFLVFHAVEWLALKFG